ncbi:MAG: hypothetical protein ABI875_02280 [Gemmatimonadales bacterium]
MNESALMIVLRLIHIFGGIFWAGSVALIGWFVMPAQAQLGQASPMFIRELMVRRRLPVFVMTSMGLSILSGLAMYTRLAMTTNGVWAASTTGKVLGFGALSAIIGATIGGRAGAKMKGKMAAIGAKVQAGGGAPTEDQRLEIATNVASFQKSLRVVTVFLIIAIAAMASARYL